MRLDFTGTFFVLTTTACVLDDKIIGRPGM